MMNNSTKTVIMSALFLSVLNVASTAKILGIFPLPVRSHRNLYNPLMQELVQRGHDITVISPYEETTLSKNGSYTTILLSGFDEWMQEQLGALASYTKADNCPFTRIKHAAAALTKITEMTLAHDNVQTLINSNEKFDLVIMTGVLNRAHTAFAAHFRAPLVLFSTVGANSWINPLVGNPSPPSYISDIFLSTLGQLTFFERLINSFVFVFNHVYFNLYLNPYHNQLIKKYIPNGPQIDDVLYNVSLILLNSHPSLNQPVPFVPNMIDIGGFHISPPRKLPRDLQQYLDDSPDGVIYFSMGSNLRSSDFPPEKLQIFLKSFAKLKQRILWKWEDDVLPEQPPNVKVSKWLPQRDVLAHPNIKLFMTHGGLLSTTETVYHGVPILAIPIFGDQQLNAKIAVNNGFGLSVFFHDLTEEELTQKIRELLDNPKYKNNAKKRARLFHDRLVDPMDTAVYWVEYVIRYKGAPHLRVDALDLPWYKYLLLDVFTFIVLTSLVFLIIFYKITKFVCICFFSKNKQTQTKLKVK